jgi:hypothetical protein
MRGTCYQAVGWERLGPTKGYGRVWRDFYTDSEHPKELWVRAVEKGALERLRTGQLEPALAQLHWDGKVLKNARIADDDTLMTLVSVMTPDQRLAEQIQVPGPINTPTPAPPLVRRTSPRLRTSAPSCSAP